MAYVYFNVIIVIRPPRAIFFPLSFICTQTRIARMEERGKEHRLFVRSERAYNHSQQANELYSTRWPQCFAAQQEMYTHGNSWNDIEEKREALRVKLSLDYTFIFYEGTQKRVRTSKNIALKCNFLLKIVDVFSSFILLFFTYAYVFIINYYYVAILSSTNRLSHIRATY